MNDPDITIPKGSGIYSLLLELKEDMCITVGALGVIKFPAGYYSYTGSARGGGGFSRIMRHLDVAAGLNPTRRWHIDYLLLHTYTDQDLECQISGTIGSHTETIHRFGNALCSPIPRAMCRRLSGIWGWLWLHLTGCTSRGVSTMEWGTRTAINTYHKRHNRVPDVVYDEGKRKLSYFLPSRNKMMC